MSMEIRYVMFTGDETRKAIMSFVAKETNGSREDITAMEIVGDAEAPSVIARCAGKQVKLAASDLVGILLLYCRQQSIPIPKRSQKRVQRSSGGLTLVLSSDPVEDGTPVVSDNRITYQDPTTMRELSRTRQELARAVERFELAEKKLAEADARADAAEKVSAELKKAAARFTAITRVSGLRGMIGRKLVDY